MVTFASPSAVRGTIELFGKMPFDRLRTGKNGKWRNILDLPAICIGPVTANAARDAGFTNVHFPAEYTAAGMVAMLTEIVGG